MYYGLFPANRAELFAGYAAPLLQWAEPARTLAQLQAAKANVSCSAEAMHFPCHLAPWGMQSDDPKIWNHWNLLFALEPIINQWVSAQFSARGKLFGSGQPPSVGRQEWTHDLAAAEAALPLFAGATAWWSCFLQKTHTPGGSYVYHDISTTNPDTGGEGPPIPDPNNGLAHILRVTTAHIDIAAGLGLPVPTAALDIATHLAPFPTAEVAVKQYAPPVACAGTFGFSVCGCAKAGAGAELRLSCGGAGTNTGYVTGVDFASIGTPAGACGNLSEGGCRGDPAKARAYVAAACVGRHNCTVSLSLADFNDGIDPCTAAQECRRAIYVLRRRS